MNKLFLILLLSILFTIPFGLSITGSSIGNFTYPRSLIDTTYVWNMFSRVYFDSARSSIYILTSGEDTHVAGYDYNNPAYIRKYDGNYVLQGTLTFNHNYNTYNPSCSDYTLGWKMWECNWNGALNSTHMRIACNIGRRPDFTDEYGYATFLFNMDTFSVTTEKLINALDGSTTGTCTQYKITMSKINVGATGSSEQVTVHYYSTGSTKKFMRAISISGTPNVHELPMPSDTNYGDYQIVNYENPISCFGTGLFGWRGTCGQAFLYIADRTGNPTKSLYVNEYTPCSDGYGVLSCLFGALDLVHYHTKALITDTQVQRLSEIKGDSTNGWRVIWQDVNYVWRMSFFDNKWNELTSIRVTLTPTHYATFKTGSFTTQTFTCTGYSGNCFDGQLNGYFIPNDYTTLPFTATLTSTGSANPQNYIKITNSQNASDYMWVNYTWTKISGGSHTHTQSANVSSMIGKTVNIRWEINGTNNLQTATQKIDFFRSTDFPSDTITTESVMYIVYQGQKGITTSSSNTSVYIEREQPPCTCSAWTPENCYFGQRKYIRNCVPDLCQVEEYFDDDPLCVGGGEVCTSGYVCVDSDTFGLLLPDCTYTDLTDCTGGTPYCMGGTCVSGCTRGYICTNSVTQAFVDEACQQSEVVNCNSTGYGYCYGGRCYEEMRPAFEEDASVLDIIESATAGVKGMLRWLSPPLFYILMAIAVTILIMGIFGLIWSLADKVGRR
jgi:hypothetical protein